MTKKILLGSAAAMFGLALLGGTLAWADGPRHGPNGGWNGGHGGGAGWGAPGGGAGPARMFGTFDRDGDGSVTQAEIEAVRGDRLARFDTDGDGALSLDEYEPLWLDAMHRRMVRGFQRLDMDGDAVVTDAEFTGPHALLLERFDADGDGAVSRDEMRETMRDRRGRHGSREDRGPMRDGGMMLDEGLMEGPMHD